MTRKQPNYAMNADFFRAQAEARAVRDAEFRRWEGIICSDPEDVSPEDREWAREYWDRKDR